MDAYLHLLCKKHKGSLHINSVFITAIFDDNMEIHGLLSQVDLYSHDHVISAMNENGNHWTSLIILPKERTIYYMNPMGETQMSEQQLLQSWYGFLKRRYQFGIDQEKLGIWAVMSPAHAKQTDSVSCRVYVLKIAEEYLSGNSLMFNMGKDALVQYRRQIALTILSNIEAAPVRLPIAVERQYNLRKDPVKKQQQGFTYQSLRSRKSIHCVCKKTDDGAIYWQCDGCNLWFHPNCIGEKSKKEPTVFKCRDCQMSVLDLPEEVLAIVCGQVILMAGDSAYLRLSLVCKKFHNICTERSFQRKCHLTWLLILVHGYSFVFMGIKPKSFWLQENNHQFFKPFSIVECESCRQQFKEEGPGFWGGKGRKGQFLGWYDELSHPGFCSVVCLRHHENA